MNISIASLLDNLKYKDGRPSIELILETSISKEIRLVFKEGQIMKEHKAPYPILLEIFEGELDFGVSDTIYALKKGSLIALEANISHDLKAKTDCIARLSLSKYDSSSRVEDTVKTG